MCHYAEITCGKKGKKKYIGENRRHCHLVEVTCLQKEKQDKFSQISLISGNTYLLGKELKKCLDEGENA